MTLLHRCRFVDWMPQAINAMDMSPSGTKPLLAVSRTSGDLEFYDASQNWISRRIPCGGTVGRAIECMLWLRPSGVRSRKFFQCKGHGSWSLTQAAVIPRERGLPTARLITAGHDGNLVEWDVERMRPKMVKEAGGGGIWAMAASPDETRLALACADGRVRIVDARTFETEKILPPSGDGTAKLLSLSWSKMSPTLVAAGTSDSCILVWDTTSNGHLLHRINIESIFCTPTMIWSVRFAGKTLVSGNSLGQVQFWNPRLGTHMTTCKLHKVDVLTIAVHPSQRHIFTCGADGRTIEFKVGGMDKMIWRPCGKRTDHTHDIRAAVFARVPCLSVKGEKSKVHRHGILVTGGNDTKIVMYDPFGKKMHETRVISPLPKQPAARLAKAARIIAASAGNSIKIWALGTLDHYVLDKIKDVSQESKQKEKFMLSQPGRFLLQVNVPGEETIGSFDITSKADLLVYTTRSALRLYSLKFTRVPTEDVDVTRIGIPENDFGVPQAVCFANDSLMVTYLSEARSILVSYSVEAETGVVKVKNVIELASEDSAVAIDMISVNGNFTAIHDLRNVVYLINKDKLVSRYTKLPSFVQTMQVLPSTIVLITADRGIHQLTLPGNELIPSAELPSQWKSSPEHIVGLTMVPNTRRNFRIWTESSVIQIDLDKPLVITPRSKPKPSKKTKSTKETNVTSAKTATTSDAEAIVPDNIVGNFERFFGYKNIMLVDYISADEAIIIERPWEAVSDDLPEAQERKKFGGF